MVKMTLKTKFLMFGFMISFMLIYMFLFGNKNATIGMMVVMATFMNLGNDLSYKPKLSFVKVLFLFLILGTASFFNNPLSIFACILTFIIVFITTFSTYRLFGVDVYLPFLMMYFMMLSIPVSFEELPLRLLSLVFGAIFYLGLNLIVNKKKEYKLTKATLSKLINELNKSIDLKLSKQNVSKKDFVVIDGFYSSIYNKFEYKIFPTPIQESVLNVVKAFQYIGAIICDYNLTDKELNYLKDVLPKIRDIEPTDIYKNICIETKEMNLILLNLEIIVNEIQNKDLTKDTSLPNKKYIKTLIKPLLKRGFSFRSAKFTFAFKMSVVLTFWEVLTLLFNLPYSKWLYFVSIPLMLPYIDDFTYTAKTRIHGTIIGVSIFTLIVIILPFLNISQNTLMFIVLIVCMFGMIYKLEDKLILTIFTTIISVTVSLMYIPPEMAIPLKILWVVVGASIVAVINFGFLPYSVEKETKNNLQYCYNFNKKSINLIKDKCNGINHSSKTSLLVISNIVSENIEVTNENKELYSLQKKITDITTFILNYIDINGLSSNLKTNLLCIINGECNVDENLNTKDKIISYSTQHLISLFKKEEEIIKTKQV